MDLLSKETELKIFEYLRDIGCCMCCSLRFVGVRGIEVFKEPAKNAVKLKFVPENESVGELEEAPCTACLGILQDITHESAVTKMITVIQNGNYDEETFNSALTLPICLFLRDRSIQIALADKFQLSDIQRTNLKIKTQNLKEIWKYRVSEKVVEAVGKRVLAAPEPSPLLVEITFSYKDDNNELRSLSRSTARKKQPILYSRKTIETTLVGITNEAFRQCYTVPPEKPKSFVEITNVSCVCSSIFLGGRYAKYSRELSQTPWFIQGEKKMETSVQDLLCGRMIELTKAESVKFLSSGREDVDVRNIHSGRPFAVEMVHPKHTKISDNELAEVVTMINQSTDLVQVTSKLKILNNDDLKILKQGETGKSKVYRALCTLKETSKELVNLEKLEGIKDLDIVQKTPLRVLHRRPLASRVRRIHAMRSRWLTPDEVKHIRENAINSGASDTSHINDLFILDVKTQAGTYVKEFVHGDFGRTKPNLGDMLGGEFDIAALDVTAVNLNWP